MGIAWNSDLKGAAHLMTMIIPIEQEVRDNTKNDPRSPWQGILKAWNACLSCLNRQPVHAHTNTPQWRGTHYVSLQPTIPAPKSSWPLKILHLESQISSCKLHTGSWSHVRARFWPDWQAETFQENPMCGSYPSPHRISPLASITRCLEHLW